LFSNFAELSPTNYRYNDTIVEDPCDLSNMRLVLNPSGRVMPDIFYMFMEFFGFDEYTQTDGRESIGGTLSAALGFR